MAEELQRQRSPGFESCRQHGPIKHCASTIKSERGHIVVLIGVVVEVACATFRP